MDIKELEQERQWLKTVAVDAVLSEAAINTGEILLLQIGHWHSSSYIR